MIYIVCFILSAMGAVLSTIGASFCTWIAHNSTVITQLPTCQQEPEACQLLQDNPNLALAVVIMLGVSAAMKVTAVIFSAGAVMKNDDGLLKGSMLFQIIGGITGLVAIIIYYYLVCKILQVDATPSHFVGIAFFVGCIVTLAVARFHHLLLLPTSQYLPL